MTTTIKSCHERSDTKRVLAYVNKIRTEHMKLKPLKLLKRGVLEDATKCSIAASLTTKRFSAEVDSHSVYVHDGKTQDIAFSANELPQYMSAWVKKFDAGDFPELTLGSLGSDACPV